MIPIVDVSFGLNFKTDMIMNWWDITSLWLIGTDIDRMSQISDWLGQTLTGCFKSLIDRMSHCFANWVYRLELVLKQFFSYFFPIVDEVKIELRNISSLFTTVWKVCVSFLCLIEHWAKISVIIINLKYHISLISLLIFILNWLNLQSCSVIRMLCFMIDVCMLFLNLEEISVKWKSASVVFYLSNCCVR